MVEAAEANLRGLAEWVVPTGGMFLWFKINGVKDTQAMMERALQANVLLAPGNAFAFDTSKPSAYLRAAFSGATKEQMHEVDTYFSYL